MRLEINHKNEHGIKPKYLVVVDTDLGFRKVPSLETSTLAFPDGMYDVARKRRASMRFNL